MNYGVMQGRLSPRQFPKLNAFPHNTWRNEFALAAELRLSSIEWVFELDRYDENPIWTSSGRREIIRLSNVTGVAVSSLCANYFMPRHFYHEETFTENIGLLKELIQKSSEVGVSLILLPVLEESEIHSEGDRERLIFAVDQCLDTMRACGVHVGLETELPACDFLELVTAFDNELVGAYYDTGNSAGRGFDMKQDLAILRPVLFGVHLKDKLLNGPSVYIGSGHANFKDGIPFLKSQRYSGHIIFESFYEHDPAAEMQRNISYITSLEGDLR